MRLTAIELLASALHLVLKNNSGDGTSCWKYGTLNPVTMTDVYLVPNIQGFTANLSGTSIRSKIDLVDIPLDSCNS